MARTDTRPLKTSRWSAVRAFVAHRASFRCEMPDCHVFLGMRGDVDHVISRSVCEDVCISVFDTSNLQYLCPSCHSAKTNRERWADRGDPTGRAKAPRRVQVTGRDKFLEAAGISSPKQREPTQNVEKSGNPIGAVQAP